MTYKERVEGLLRSEFYMNDHDDCDDSCSKKYYADKAFKRATQEILHLIEEARADEVMQFLERSDTLSEEKYATRRLAELKGE